MGCALDGSLLRCVLFHLEGLPLVLIKIDASGKFEFAGPIFRRSRFWFSNRLGLETDADASRGVTTSHPLSPFDRANASNRNPRKIGGRTPWVGKTPIGARPSSSTTARSGLGRTSRTGAQWVPHWRLPEQERPGRPRCHPGWEWVAFSSGQGDPRKSWEIPRVGEGSVPESQPLARHRIAAARGALRPRPPRAGLAEFGGRRATRGEGGNARAALALPSAQKLQQGCQGEPERQEDERVGRRVVGRWWATTHERVPLCTARQTSNASGRRSFGVAPVLLFWGGRMPASRSGPGGSGATVPFPV